MPGFIDTHHHLFETALRSFLADGILINDGTPAGGDQLLRIHSAQVRPGVPAAGRLHQRAVRVAQPLDAGVTTVHDISQIHHSPEHSDAAIKALLDSGRRAAFGYFESAGLTHGSDYAISGRRAPHQEAVLLLERPAPPP